MKTLTPELASARTIGDACALKACSLNAVEDDVLARAETTSGAIKKLDVSENALSDLSGVRSTSLTWFSCANNVLKSDALAALGQNCPRIRTLNVSGNDGLRTLRGVENMHALAALIAKECGLRDIDHVRGLKELNTLACAECELRDVGDALSESPALRKVNLSKNALSKLGIDALKSSRGLRELRVAHNELKTIPPCVAKTPNLRILDVGYNKISDWGDLSALRELNRLEQLTLRGCPIANDPEYAEKITRMCPGLKLLDGRKPRDARGRPPERADATSDDALDDIDPEEKSKKRKKVKDSVKGRDGEKDDDGGGGESERSFVELFVAKNKGKVLDGDGAVAAHEEEKDPTKRTGLIGVFENKDLKRKGPCGSAAFKALLKNDAGTGLNAGTWDEDDVTMQKTKKKKKEGTTDSTEKKKKKKKDLREMTPEERKEHLRMQRKRGY